MKISTIENRISNLEEKIAKQKGLIKGLSKSEYQKQYRVTRKNYYQLKKKQLAENRFKEKYGRYPSKNPKVAKNELEQFLNG